MKSFLKISGKCSIVKNTNRILEAVGKKVENKAEILSVSLNMFE